jgi:hypothetical protein
MQFVQLKRREFLSVLGGAAAWPLAAHAQSKVRRIGVLMNGTATEVLSQSYVARFVEGLRQLGWSEGQNIRIDVRWNAGDRSSGVRDGLRPCRSASLQALRGRGQPHPLQHG